MNKSQPTNTYHHGDLRRATLDAAKKIIREKGVEKLSLREVARRAGVSPGAPYHHFKDKASLITAIANESLWELDEYSRNAAEAAETPQEKLEALGLAYILYATQHPREFGLMFGPADTPFLSKAIPSEAPVFRVLLEVVSAFGIDDDQGFTAAVSAWSLVHGLAVLLISGPLQPLATDKSQVEQLAKEVTRKLRF